METVDIGQFQANCKPDHQYIKKKKNLEINQNQKIKINKKLYNDKKSNTKRFKYLMLDEDSKNSYQNYAIFNRENRIQPQMTAKLIERADTANGMTGICGEGSQREGVSSSIWGIREGPRNKTLRMLYWAKVRNTHPQVTFLSSPPADPHFKVIARIPVKPPLNQRTLLQLKYLIFKITEPIT